MMYFQISYLSYIDDLGMKCIVSHWGHNYIFILIMTSMTYHNYDVLWFCKRFSKCCYATTEKQPVSRASHGYCQVAQYSENSNNYGLEVSFS